MTRMNFMRVVSISPRRLARHRALRTMRNRPVTDGPANELSSQGEMHGMNYKRNLLMTADPSRRRPLHQRLSMPRAQHRHIARDLRSQSRMCEQNHERCVRDYALELCHRRRPQVAPSLPRPWLGINKDNALSATGYRLSGGAHAKLRERRDKNVSGRDRVRSADIIINDRHTKTLAEPRLVATQQMQ